MPNAIDGRDGVENDIIGMKGIPEDFFKEDGAGFHETERTGRRAATRPLIRTLAKDALHATRLYGGLRFYLSGRFYQN